MQIHYRTADIHGVSVFYREAGPADAPAVLLLHGFGASSHMFRELIPVLAQRYRAIARLGVEPQLDLLLDYGSNIRQYPQLHAFFRQHQPPTLAIWGKNDPFFIPAGAEAYKRDNPKAEVRFLDTGHFALETNGAEIAARMLEFLDRNVER